MNNFIAITGFTGAGKDTLANILVTDFGFVKLSFATVLKDIVSIIFDWNRDMLEGVTLESRIKREQVDEWWSQRLNIQNLTPRWVLQHFGTELFRNHFHQDIWIAVIEKQLLKYNKIVITDCRFPNEYEMLKKYGFLFITIQRNDNPFWFSDLQNNIISEPPCQLHSSDQIWIKFNTDFIVYNNSTIDFIKQQIQSIFDQKN